MSAQPTSSNSDTLVLETNILELFPLSTLVAGENTDKALEMARRERERIRRAEIMAKNACYEKFLVNYCLGNVHKKILTAKYALDDVTNRAKELERLARTEAAEKRRADAQARREQDLPQTEQAEQAAMKEFADKQQRYTQKQAQDEADAVKMREVEAQNLKEFSDKQKRHEENLKKQRQEQAQEAKNRLNFMNKQKKAQQHAADVERKKREKEPKEMQKFKEKQEKAAEHAKTIEEKKRDKEEKNLAKHN